jgi:hypothetical protein
MRAYGKAGCASSRSRSAVMRLAAVSLRSRAGRSTCAPHGLGGQRHLDRAERNALRITQWVHSFCSRTDGGRRPRAARPSSRPSRLDAIRVDRRTRGRRPDVHVRPRMGPSRRCLCGADGTARQPVVDAARNYFKRMRCGIVGTDQSPRRLDRLPDALPLFHLDDHRALRDFRGASARVSGVLRDPFARRVEALIRAALVLADRH